MKHQQQYHSTRLLLPQAAAPDHPSPACNRRSAMEEIARGQSLVTQLRAIVLPALQADQRSELVAHMFQNILDCSSKAMAELQLHHHRSPSARRPRDDDGDGDGDVLVDDKKRVKRISSVVGCKEEEAGVTAAANPRRHQHKRRRLDDSVSLETPVPHYDGRQWRKYGQKHINNTKHSRSYYRCTYRQEQGCKATKTVQQQDDSSGADHSTLMYTVVYYGQHTCNKDHNDGNSSRPDDSETNTRSSSDSQSSILSTCCAADPGGHQNQTTSSLLHGSKPIDDGESAEELVMAKYMREPFDMASFAPLDLDSWELDALLRFGA